MIVSANAEEPKPEAQNRDQATFGSFQTMADSAHGLDWGDESARWLKAVDNLWERNGWDSDAHRYAKKLVKDVAVIPPWDIMGRFDAMTSCIKERYDLTPDQVARLQGALFRETGGLLMKHSRLIMDQAAEMLETRAAGRPFTPEQVARWTKDGEPLTRESRESADRLRAEFEPLLRPDQKEVWSRDWDAFDERWRVVNGMRAEWVEGKWSPADWGLEDDPIQRGLMPGGPGAASALTHEPGLGEARAVPVPQASWVAYDPSTWKAFVRDMQRTYKLDLGQMDAAWSIHAELVERASVYIETRKTQLQNIPASERSTHEMFEPVRSIFEELRERLDAMLTDRQREQGGSK